MPRKAAPAQKRGTGRRVPPARSAQRDSEDDFATNDVIKFDPASSSDSDEGEEAVFDIGRAVEDSDEDDSESDDFGSEDDTVPRKSSTNTQKTSRKQSSDDDEGEAEDDSEENGEDSDHDTAGLGGDNAALPKLGWGNRRSTFYNADTGTHQLDEQDALDEEKEAIRLQKKHAEELNEEDFALGVGAPATKAGKSAVTPSKAGAKGTASLDVEQIQKSADLLTKDEKLKMVAEESPELLTLLQDLKIKVEELRERIIPVLKRVRSGELPTDAGVSFLEVKHQLLMTYVTNVTFYLLLKAEGKSTRDHPVMDQLHHIRTILERIRPVDAKLKHQINRLVKAATSDGEAGGDEDVHKPRPQALVAHDGKLNKKGTNVDASEGDDDEGSADEEHGDVYKPLKRSAVMFEEGGATAKAAREEERRKARAAKSKLFKDLLGMYSEAPEEIAAAGDTEAVDESLKQRDEDRRRFEEDHFVRLTVPRGEKTLKKKRERERLRVDPLKDLTTGFAEIERLAGMGDEGSEDDDLGEDGKQFYRAAAKASTVKKAKRDEEGAAKRDAARRAAMDAYVEEDVDGERRASKDIIKNRGLTKYRNKERKNPRKNQRIKYEKALKRRTGQVGKSRVGEADRYGGEALGIRTTVSRSHKIA